MKRLPSRLTSCEKGVCNGFLLNCNLPLLIVVYRLNVWGERKCHKSESQGSGRGITQIGFGEYQKELWQEYNLIFVDATYGYETDSFILPEEHYVGYLNENFDEGGVSFLGGRDLLKLEAYYAETDNS